MNENLVKHDMEITQYDPHLSRSIKSSRMHSMEIHLHAYSPLYWQDCSKEHYKQGSSTQVSMLFRRLEICFEFFLSYIKTDEN